MEYIQISRRLPEKKNVRTSLRPCFSLIPLAFSTYKSIGPFLGHVNDNKADGSESEGLSDIIQKSRLRRGLLLVFICFCY